MLKTYLLVYMSAVEIIQENENAHVQLRQTEFEELKNLNAAFVNATTALGDIEMQKINLNQKRVELDREIEALQLKKNEYFFNIEKNYGRCNLNIETGEITSIKES